MIINSYSLYLWIHITKDNYIFLYLCITIYITVYNYIYAYIYITLYIYDKRPRSKEKLIYITSPPGHLVFCYNKIVYKILMCTHIFSGRHINSHVTCCFVKGLSLFAAIRLPIYMSGYKKVL